MFHNELIANLPLNLSVKKNENWSTFGEVTDNSIVGCFFDSHCRLKEANLPLPLDLQTLKAFQLQGVLFMTRGFVPGTC